MALAASLGDAPEWSERPVAADARGGDRPLAPAQDAREAAIETALADGGEHAVGETWLRATGRRGVPLREDYRRVAAGEADRGLAGKGVETWLVRTRGHGPRTATRPGTVDATLDGAGQPVRVTFAIRDGGRPATDVLLVDEAGRPHGLVDGGPCALAAPFHGFLLAPSRTPVPVRIGSDTTRVLCELRPRCYVRGKVAGRRATVSDLLVGIVPAGGRTESHADVGDDGSFEIGPLVPGPCTLLIGSRTRALRDIERHVDLVEGWQDLGVLAVDESHSLHVHVEGMTRGEHGYGYCFARDHRAVERAVWARGAADARPLVVADDGCVVFEDMAAGAWSGWIWTRDGRVGRFDSGRCPEAGERTRCRLEGSGSLDVSLIGASESLLAKGRIVVQDEGFGERPAVLAWRSAHEPWLRVRLAAPGRDRPTRVDGVWPGGVLVSLLDGDDRAVASVRTVIRPGGVGQAVLLVEAPGSTLTLRNELPRARRVALVRRKDGSTTRLSIGAAASRRLEAVAPGDYDVVLLDVDPRCEVKRWRLQVEPGRELSWLLPESP